MFEWLTTYKELENEIAFLEYNLENTQSELKRWIYGDLRGVRLTEGSEGGKVEQRLEAIENELAFKKERMSKLISLVNDFEGLDNKILKLKYVDGMTLEQIAEEVNYSTSHIKKKHAELIRIIQFAEKKGII